MNFDKVVWLLDCEDYDKNVRLPKVIPRRKVLWSSDTNVIYTLKQSLWNYHGSDMCSVLSKILFFRDNRLIKSYYIVLETNQIGIQSCETGWVESTQRDELLSVFASFSPYHGILFDVNKWEINVLTDARCGGLFPLWLMFGSPLLFSLGWICSPAQLSNRICNSYNNGINGA